MTEKAARRHGFHTLLDYLGGIPEEVLRRLVKVRLGSENISSYLSRGDFSTKPWF